nr:hypothetical protein [uncultured Desulfobacter sp.]
MIILAALLILSAAPVFAQLPDAVVNTPQELEKVKKNPAGLYLYQRPAKV